MRVWRSNIMSRFLNRKKAFRDTVCDKHLATFLSLVQCKSRPDITSERLWWKDRSRMRINQTWKRYVCLCFALFYDTSELGTSDTLSNSDFALFYDTILLRNGLHYNEIGYTKKASYFVSFDRHFNPVSCRKIWSAWPCQTLIVLTDLFIATAISARLMPFTYLSVSTAINVGL